MKGHPLAQREFEGAVIEPVPAGREAWDQLAIFVEFDQMLEDVQRNPGPILVVLVHNAQFPPRRGGLFPQAPGAPAKGDEDKDDAADDKVLHGGPSLAWRFLESSEDATWLSLATLTPN